MRNIKLVFGFLAFLFFSATLNAQYFGKNKVKYKNFDFKIIDSKSYDTYYYTKNDSLIEGVVRDAELWKSKHYRVFKDTFDYKVPLILYANHGDFQQSSVVGGLIGTSTGGVTEGLKNRVILPLTYSYGQTNHVLGHELVHTHQYNMLKSNDSLSFKNMANVPLWMTEGLAEYMSIGNVDSHTAMWMRDAVLNDYFPTIKTLYKSKYFPYRYGQNFWAFVGGTFGDDKIFPLYKETAFLGVKEGFERILGLPIDSFSTKWKATNKKYYEAFLENHRKKPFGKKLVDAKNGGRLNIAPAVSPNGKYFIFLSEKDIFSIDLYLADAKTGSIIKKLSTRTKTSHLDDLAGFNSSGTWSPNSQKYAFVIYSKGRNKIVISDIVKNKVVSEFFIKNIASIENLAWSPDGTTILFSALKEGQSDLYTVNISNQKVTQITNDKYANMQPNWSPDGKTIVFTTDFATSAKNNLSNKASFAFLDVATGKILYPKVFVGADNLNPVFTASGEEVLFLSDREGFRDLYAYNIDAQTVTQKTNFYTGISGITKYSSALTYSNKTNEILYSFYFNGLYEIYKAKVSELLNKEVAIDAVHQEAALLPSLNLQKTFVTKNLAIESYVLLDSISKKNYKPKMQLQYISNGGVGVSTSRYGNGLVGGINMLFGDMLNDQQIYAGAVLNGELQDFGVQGAYVNKKNRLAWGGSLSHVPYKYVSTQYALDTIVLNSTPTTAIKQTYNIFRIFNNQLSAFTYFPFSKNHRLEASTSFNYYTFRLDKINNYYDQSGTYFFGQDRDRNIPVSDPINFQDVSLAYVVDDSSFGLTSPMKGSRMRFEIQQSVGSITSTSFLTDIRKYFFLKPVTLAFKAYHYSRFGKDADNPFTIPLYLGYETLVRGYNYKAFSRAFNLGANDLQPNDLLGNKMFVGNFEVRFPLTGPERLAAIKSGMFFSDLNFFVDTGVVWGQNARNNIDRTLKQSKVISSVGLSLRVNLFGQLILEPYYGFPLSLKGNKQGVFGLNFSPGW